MTDLTPESPSVRLSAQIERLEPRIALSDMLRYPTHMECGERLAAEHDRLVTERLAAVVAERDAAIAERDRLRGTLGLCETKFEVIRRLTIQRRRVSDVAENGRDIARAALNPEAKP